MKAIAVVLAVTALAALTTTSVSAVRTRTALRGDGDDPPADGPDRDLGYIPPSQRSKQYEYDAKGNVVREKERHPNVQRAIDASVADDAARKAKGQKTQDQLRKEQAKKPKETPAATGGDTTNPSGGLQRVDVGSVGSGQKGGGGGGGGSAAGHQPDRRKGQGSNVPKQFQGLSKPPQPRPPKKNAGKKATKKAAKAPGGAAKKKAGAKKAGAKKGGAKKAAGKGKAGKAGKAGKGGAAKKPKKAAGKKAGGAKKKPAAGKKAGGRKPRGGAAKKPKARGAAKPKADAKKAGGNKGAR